MNTDGTSRTTWWSDKHTTAWERAKEALRRDWEQTKSDFSSHDGISLNQSVGDTVLQASGANPVPPLTVKTRPDEPLEISKRIEKEVKERGKAQQEITAAQTEVAVEQVKAQFKIAQQQLEAQQQITREQEKLGTIVTDVREAIAEDTKAGQEKLAKQQAKITDVRARSNEVIAEQQEKIDRARQDWSQIEPAIRYGYGARIEHAQDPAWDDQIESRLRSDWAEMNTNIAWDDARADVRYGWDSAGRTSNPL